MSRTTKVATPYSLFSQYRKSSVDYRPKKSTPNRRRRKKTLLADFLRRPHKIESLLFGNQHTMCRTPYKPSLRQSPLPIAFRSSQARMRLSVDLPRVRFSTSSLHQNEDIRKTPKIRYSN